MIKFFGVLTLSAALTGCANNNYTLNNQQYSGEEAFLVAVNTDRANRLSEVKPLAGPLTEKKLVALLPSEQALRAENTSRRNKAVTRNITPHETKLIDTLATANYQLLRAFFEAVEKRGIYKSVEIRDAGSVMVSAEPAADYDVMYYTEPVTGSGQFFYASAKYGKQVFAYDLSGGTPQAKSTAFVEAVQALAIRN